MTSKLNSEQMNKVIRHYSLDRPVYRGIRYLFGTLVTDDDFRFLLDNDQAAMQSDWQAIGKDMNSAIKNYESLVL